MPTGILMGLLASSAIISPFLIRGAASTDFGFTNVRGGEGKIVVASGDFVRVIMSFKGYHLNVPGKHYFDPDYPEWEVLPNDPGVPDAYYDDRNPIVKYVGAYWVGIPGLREIGTHSFEWTEQELEKDAKDGSKGSYKIRTRKEPKNSVFKVNDFPYIMVEPNARARGNLQMYVLYQLTVRITNPKKAIYETDDWLQTISGLTNGVTRNYIGEFTPDQLASETDEDNELERLNEDFGRRLIALNRELPRDKHGTDDPQGTVGRYGITIVAGELLTVMPAGTEGSNVMEAVTAFYVAQQQRRVREEQANGEAYYIKTTKSAEAEGIELVANATAEGDKKRLEVLDAHPESGQLLLVTGALKPTDKTILVGGVGAAEDLINFVKSRPKEK